MSFHIFLLCFVQGISEFLPVSSSAHLLLLSELFKYPTTSLEWEVALHFGTLAAVILYFYKDLWSMTKAVIKGICTMKIPSADTYCLKAWHLALATIPAVIAGYFVKKIGGVSYSPHFIGIMSIVFGILLYIVDKFSKHSEADVTTKKAIGIGLMQTLAFIPGVSRSGSCITAARAFGLNRVEATRFAFLLSIPTVLGAVALTTYDVLKENIPLDFAVLGPAVLLTAAIGLCVIHGILTFLQRHSFGLFTIYRVILGGILLLFL
ncbi:MAG: undecaprenyl-diphosphate phosphatase [Alphaproteobacteria bacterium]|jgi:undecaprenyl-diphosphatase|nr:undecaprenyl-diphosphate phosphatase [Alphaproteobacteria bacterium]